MLELVKRFNYEDENLKELTNKQIIRSWIILINEKETPTPLKKSFWEPSNSYSQNVLAEVLKNRLFILPEIKAHWQLYLMMK